MPRPVPGLTIEQQPQLIVARMALYGEARGERDRDRDLDGVAMACVYQVAVNRAHARATTPKDEFLRYRQFSTFNTGDPNREQLLQAFELDRISWERADAIADVVEAGGLEDLTRGATHYCTLTLWNSDAPGQWYGRQEIAAGRTVELYRRDNHVFARAA